MSDLYVIKCVVRECKVHTESNVSKKKNKIPNKTQCCFHFNVSVLLFHFDMIFKQVANVVHLFSPPAAAVVVVVVEKHSYRT